MKKYYLDIDTEMFIREFNSRCKDHNNDVSHTYGTLEDEIERCIPIFLKQILLHDFDYRNFRIVDIDPDIMDSLLVSVDNKDVCDILTDFDLLPILVSYSVDLLDGKIMLELEDSIDNHNRTKRIEYDAD